MKHTKFEHIIVLGITGKVGAGKSTILNYLHESLCAFIIECDQVGKELQAEGGACYDPMVRLFGKQILKEDGSVDRGKVAKVIFENSAKREALNAIVHPAVKAEVSRRLEDYDRDCGREADRKRLAVVEAALLIDDHYEELCDEIWYVYTEDGKRRERLKASRGYSDERIDRMFLAQRSDASFRANTQYTIDNSDDIVQNTYKQLKDGLEKHFPDLFIGGDPWISAV